MASICGRKSTDPKDKVFALYGVFRALGIHPPDPDYGKPVGQIYQETTRSIIEAQGSLDMLYLGSGTTSNLVNIPSWTPDWTNDSYNVPMIVSNRVMRHYKAAGNSRAIFLFSEDSSHCLLRGKVLDEVAICGGVLPKPPLGLRTGSLWSVYHTVITLKHWISLALCQATDIEPSWLLYDILSELGLPGSCIKDESLYNKWLSIIMDDASCCQHINSGRERTRFINATKNTWVKQPNLDMDFGFFTTTPEFKALFHFGEHPGLSEFHLNVGAYVLESQFLITLGGNFAKGPPTVRAGDIMVLISGVELPMFLRASDDGFILVGPGYMHGVMYGEGWSEESGDLMQFRLV